MAVRRLSNGLTEKQMENRDKKLNKLYWDKGLSVRAISRQVGLSKTRVHEIVAYE